MSLQCAHCYKSFSIAKVADSRGKGLSVEVQCPHCAAWLGHNKFLSFAKMIGFYGGVTAAAIGYFAEDVTFITTPVVILAVIMIGLSHIMDHLQLVESPENDPTTETNVK
ncbi:MULTISPECIES: hypothetical protein [Shewanella]|uniref:Uncharacterized protein n=1 Tax=Shewanella polaris TaxID=2588449 RepID=A0A4Y5YJD9_9GAMM|nr:hypothetical protein [Shewanella polaris]QDE32646.1 hypothetical protein FH971_17765 [Shewanella polaris]